VYEKIAQTIQRFDLFPEDSPIVVGVSGGADSLCLLDCLIHLGFNVIVAHLDHQLRSESRDEVEYVQGISERYDVPYVTEAVDVRELSKAGGSLEEVARLARYNYLAQVAEEHNAQYVAVGHTADDQVETIIMHLLRGSGPAGLQGMLPKTGFTQWVGIESRGRLDLARPLIERSRAETTMHCQQHRLTPLDDPSNVDLTYYRNRIRHELLPQLETYNPGIRQVILRLSEVMREQVDFNQTHLEASWSHVMSGAGSGGYFIDREAFATLHPFLKSSLIRRAISQLTPALRDISHDATLRAVSWLEGGRGPLALPGGLSLEWVGENAFLHKSGYPYQHTAYPRMSIDSELRLTWPGEVLLDHGWRISARLETSSVEKMHHWTNESGHQIAVFCAVEFPSELTVRTRKPGDRIKLPAVEGTTKIADLMINRKIPRQVRASWPLVLGGEVVLWVPGIQRSDESLIDEDTSDVITLQLHPPEEVSHVDTLL
jgi:tRNA(Ile)-lysidine synthase